MIHETPPLKGLNIEIPVMIPIKGIGFINQGSGLPKEEWLLTRHGQVDCK